MSITTTSTKDSYTGNNSTSTPYPITFKYLEDSHITVYVDGVALSNSYYTLTGDGSLGTGQFTTALAYAGTQKVVVVLDVPFDQPVELLETGALSSSTLEEAYDRLNMQIRRVWRKAQNVLTFSTDEGGTGSTGTADTLVGFDDAGDLGEIPNTTFAQTANNLSDVDAATARTNLDVDQAGTRFALSELTDTTITNPVSGETLEWNGAAWVNQVSGSTVTASDTAPVSPDAGDLWFDSTTTQMFVYYNDGSSSQWVTVTSGSPSTDSATVTYTPYGTGAVATTVETKLKESVSVKDFGAKGDGVTDDTAAIQAAVDSAYSRDATTKVTFKQGEKYLLKGLQLPDASVILDLSGAIIIIDGSHGILFPPTISQNADIIPFFSILNGYFIIRSNHSAIYAHSEWSQLMIPASTIRGNTFDISTQAGTVVDAIISLQGLISININDNTFFGNGTEVDYNGIVSTYTDDFNTSVMNVRIYDNMFKRISNCVVMGDRVDPVSGTVGRSEGWSINNNTFIHCYGVCVKEERSLLSEVRGNTFTQISTGVLLSGSHCSLMANTFEGVRVAGIKIQGGSDYIVENTNATGNVFKLYNNATNDYDGAVAVKVTNVKDYGIRGLLLSGNTIYGETDKSQNGIEFVGNFIQIAVDCTGITGVFLDNLFYSVATSENIRGRFTLENTELVNSKFNTSNPFKDVGGGKYDPTLTGTNIDSATAPNVNYSVSGVIVTVFGAAVISQTASGVTTINISLPIPSNLTASGQLYGKIERKAGDEYGYIIGDPAGDTALVTINTALSGAQSYHFSFQYLVR